MTVASLEELVVQTAAMVRPPERLSVAEAAAKYRKLRNPGSYVGPWLNTETPYLVEPMEELTSLDYTGLIFAGPARCGKSDMFFNYLAYTAICDPADMMVVHMTQGTARDWSQGDLRRVFRHSPDIGKHVTPGRQNMNVHDIRFLSGMRLMIKWPTITELSGKTIPRLWLVDYDRMGQDVDKEGNPYDLTKTRATTFDRYGMTVAESSPGFTVDNPRWIAQSPHEAPPTEGILSLYNRGDRRRWYWRCPQCHEAFEPDFSLLNYPESKDLLESAEQVTMVCPHDGFPIPPDMKYELNLGGRWVKDGQRIKADGSLAGEPLVRPNNMAVRSSLASFWLKGPAARFSTWHDLVLLYLKAVHEYVATGSEGSLKTVTTNHLGVPYTPKALSSDRLPEDLKARAEDWGGSADAPVVPPGVRFLVATIDVQGRSFVCHVHGVGVGGDVWIVDMFKIRKSERLDDDGERYQLDPGGYPEDWQTLVPQVIERTYPLGDGSGRHMQIKMVGSDSGGQAGVTTNAYAFWRWLRDEHPTGHHRRTWLIKGEPSRSAPRFRLGYPDAQRRDRHSGARGDVPVVFFNSDLMKDQAWAMLGRADPGGGMVHFPAWAEDWLYTQLTNEVRGPKGWDKIGSRRNEAFDLLYYAVGLGLHPQLRVEHIDWENPPGWAAEWDVNDLVSAADNTKRFDSHEKGAYKLSDLGGSLL